MNHDSFPFKTDYVPFGWGKKKKLGDNKKTIGDRIEGNVFYLNYINYKLYYLNYLKLQR